MSAEFAALLNDLCDLAGAPGLDPGVDADDMVVDVCLDEVSMSLLWQAHAPQSLQCTVTLGPLPPQFTLQACHALLQLNTRLLHAGASFGRNPSTGDIVLRQSVALPALTVQDLHQRMQHWACGARGWREHHFLTPEVASHPVGFPSSPCV